MIQLYRNNKINLDFPMPTVLKKLIKEADAYYEKDDWFWYDIRVSEIESTTKQYLLCGLITQGMFQKDMEAIWNQLDKFLKPLSRQIHKTVKSK